MKRRLLWWALAGFSIALYWAVYAALAAPVPLPAVAPALWVLIGITCPLVGASVSFHFALSIYFALLGNAVTYASVGVLVEKLRGRRFPMLG